MATLSGTIILNGVTDQQMEKIWGFKAKHGHSNAFAFLPNQMQPVGNANPAVYNNVYFSYNSLQGLNLLAEIMNEIHKKEETRVAAGQ